MLNENVSLEHLRLVFNKICAQVPEAASIAPEELLMAVRTYYYTKVSPFLGVDSKPVEENLSADICHGVVQAYDFKASEHIL